VLIAVKPAEDESKDEFGYGTTEDDNNHKQE
jgi:hypothetical protein